MDATPRPLFSLLPPSLPLLHGPEGSGSSLPRKAPSAHLKALDDARLLGLPSPEGTMVSLFSPGRLLAASAFFHNGIQGVQDSLQVPLCFDVRDLLLKGEEEAEWCPQAPSGNMRNCQQRAARSEPAQCCCVLRQTPTCPRVTSQHKGEDDNT